MTARRFGIGVVGLLLVGSIAAAQTARDERAIFTLTVNAVDKGEVVLRLRSPDVWAPVGTLEGAGLRGFAGTRLAIGREPHVMLASLAPGITYTVDERALSLVLTAHPSLLGTTRVDMRPAPPPKLFSGRSPSAFVNYAGNWRQGGSYDLFTEAGLSLGPVLATSSFTPRSDGPTLRGFTQVTFDRPRRLQRWVLGDSFATTGDLGGSLLMGGVSVSREFGLDPYFRRYPTIALAGAVTTPSTLEVYANGQLLRREQVPPGEFRIEDVPVPTGRGATRVIIRDAFGREHDLVSPYYLTTSVLSRGLQEYSYHLGYRRDDSRRAYGEYRDPAFLARHRIGLTDTFTLGVRLEATGDLVSGGSSAVARLPYGEVEVAGAVSRDQGRTGMASVLRYRYVGGALNFGAGVRSASDTYATIGARAGAGRSTMDADAFFGIRLGSVGSLTVQQSLVDRRIEADSRQTTVSGAFRLAARSSIFFNAIHRRQVIVDRQMFVGVSVSMGRASSASFSREQTSSAGRTAVELQRSLPIGEGYGYRARLQQGGGDAVAGGVLQYQGKYGRYEAASTTIAGRQSASFSMAGGLLAIGGGVYATRPVQDAFALVRVPGMAGVRVYASNQEVGRTNRHGDVLVPNLISYYGNRISIADQDVPLMYGVEANERLVAPPVRGGAVALFPVRRQQIVTGTLRVEREGRSIVPAYGQLRVGSGAMTVESPIGAGGEFYLENLPSGTHVAVVEFEDGVCEFPLKTPDASLPLVRLGVLHCVSVPEGPGRQP